ALAHLDRAEIKGTAARVAGQVVAEGGSADGSQVVEGDGKATANAADCLVATQRGILQHEALNHRRNAAAEAGAATWATPCLVVLHGAPADSQGAPTAGNAAAGAAPGAEGKDVSVEDEEPTARTTDRLVASQGAVGQLSVHPRGD